MTFSTNSILGSNMYELLRQRYTSRFPSNLNQSTSISSQTDKQNTETDNSYQLQTFAQDLYGQAFNLQKQTQSHVIDYNAIVDFVATFNSSRSFIEGNSSTIKPDLLKKIDNIISNNRMELKNIGITVSKSNTLLVNEDQLHEAIANKETFVRDTFLGKGNVGNATLTLSASIVSNPYQYLTKSTTQSTGSLYNNYY